MSKRNRLIMVLAVLLISLLSAGCGKQENTKKPEDLQATPTAGVSAVPEEKYVTSVKGYPTEPEAGSEMEQVWKVKSYFEEYLFDRDGKCNQKGSRNLLNQHQGLEQIYRRSFCGRRR